MFCLVSQKPHHQHQAKYDTNILQTSATKWFNSCHFTVSKLDVNKHPISFVTWFGWNIIIWERI